MKAAWRIGHAAWLFLVRQHAQRMHQPPDWLAVLTAAPRAPRPQAKIESIAANIYGAGSVEYSPEAEAALEQYTRQGFADLPVCMAKTQYSFRCRGVEGGPGWGLQRWGEHRSRGLATSREDGPASRLSSREQHCRQSSTDSRKRKQLSCPSLRPPPTSPPPPPCAATTPPPRAPPLALRSKCARSVWRRALAGSSRCAET